MNLERHPASELDETETTHGTVEAKELIIMLAEMRDREEEVVRIIEEALGAPIPDQNDQVAMDDFNHRMATIKELIPVYISRSELLMELQTRINGKIKKAHPDQ